MGTTFHYAQSTNVLPATTDLFGNDGDDGDDGALRGGAIGRRRPADEDDGGAGERNGLLDAAGGAGAGLGAAPTAETKAARAKRYAEVCRAGGFCQFDGLVCF